MRTSIPRMSRRGRITVLAVVVVLALLLFLSWLVNAWTDWLWFSEVHYTAVFTTVLWTRVGMFLVFGVAMGAFLALNLWLAYRFRPFLRGHTPEQQALERYRYVLAPRMRLVITLISVLVGFFTGLAAQANWSQYLLFANAQPFGVGDPQFGIDIGWFIFKYPFYRYLVGVGFTAVVLSVLGALALHYVFGGVRLQGAGDRITPAARAHLSSLIALFVLLKAIAYVLDKRGLVLMHNDGTSLWGAGYTGINALLPAKEILAWISVVVAASIVIFSNAFVRNLVWPGLALGLLVLAAIAVGGIYPASKQFFTVRPNIRDKEAPYIQRSIDATRAAFALSDVMVTNYPSDTTVPPASLATDQDTVANIRLLDPSVVSNTYTQLQQVRAFYDFTQKLDIDRYTVGGDLQDYVVGIRELDYNSLTGSQNNWQNEHTIYTHGYGFVAAPANQTVCLGQPYFVSGFLGSQNPAAQACQSDTDQFPVAQPRIYYGENMGSYAIVGKAPGGADAEYDRPSGSNSDQYVTYSGTGGVTVSSYIRRMLYAYKYKEFNFLISNVFNQNSKILYVRDPRERVQKVAPFLTLDGDPYPAVIDGRVTWILDGYTTADTYPYSDQVDLQQATSDALTGQGTVEQTSQNINYLRNSVKATVDAYNGTVTLYAFDGSDPVLRAWNKAFGGHLIKPASAIPPELAAHFRYPEDQFKVQRELLTRFHVTDPHQFYSQQNVWAVPDDPAPESAAVAGLKQAPYFLLAKFPGESQATFQLTAAMTPRNRQNLAAVVTGSYLNGKPTLRIYQLPDDTTVPGPVQIHQKMSNDQSVRPQLTLYSTSRVIFGNLLSLPVGGGMLYIEPVYIQSNANNVYPLMKKVLLNFGQYVAFEDTIAQGINSLIAQASGTPPPTGSVNPPPTGGGNGGLSAAVSQINKALSDLKAAQASGNFADYGKALQELQDAINAYNQAVAASGGGTASPAPKPSG